jgi:hypothetical protein
VEENSYKKLLIAENNVFIYENKMKDYLGYVKIQYILGLFRQYEYF